MRLMGNNKRLRIYKIQYAGIFKMKKKLNILELAIFSAGGCGVFNRVKNESIRLGKLGHNVTIFSSNYEKDTWRKMPKNDKINGIRIARFPAMKLGGESYMNWGFRDELLKLRPDVIIAHSYRHPHTHKALRLAKIIGSKVILVPHAPFVEKNVTRTWIETLIVKIYDYFIPSRTLNLFDKVIAITRWETEILIGLGCDRNRIVYIPNGIPEEFFRQKASLEEKKILFLGRISPVKSIETIINSLTYINDKNLVFEIVGIGKDKYIRSLRNLVKKLDLEKRVIFSESIFPIKEKIKKIDSAKIFVLASKTEALPQALLEAMSRKKIVISSNTRGAKSIIRNGKNGYLFDIGDYKGLALKINKLENNQDNQIRVSARNTTMKFRSDKLINDLNSLLLELVSS